MTENDLTLQTSPDWLRSEAKRLDETAHSLSQISACDALRLARQYRDRAERFDLLRTTVTVAYRVSRLS